MEPDRKVDRAEATGARLILATMTAPPIRTFRRDISLIWILSGSGTSVFLIDRIVAATSLFNFPEIYDFVIDVGSVPASRICYAFKLWFMSFATPIRSECIAQAVPLRTSVD